MLTEKETAFIDYWENNRDKENKFILKLLNGFPVALLFSAPILLSGVVVRLFFPDWFAKISQTSPGMLITVLIGVILLTVFYSYFRMQYKWEMNEQLYLELKAKQRSQHKIN
jgi:hypothetical protein